MTAKIEHSCVVPYSAAQMYALVNDIARYQEFVPYCRKSDVHLQTAEVIEATLDLEFSVTVPLLGKKKMERCFSTRNLLLPNQRMDMSLISGPLKQLDGTWLFEDVAENRSRVSLSLLVEFSNSMLAMAFNAVSHQVVAKLVDAFVKRADALHGDQEEMLL